MWHIKMLVKKFLVKQEITTTVRVGGGGWGGGFEDEIHIVGSIGDVLTVREEKPSGNPNGMSYLMISSSNGYQMKYAYFEFLGQCFFYNCIEEIF